MFDSFQQASTEMSQEGKVQKDAVQAEKKAKAAIDKQILTIKEKIVENKTMQALNRIIYQAEQKKLSKETEDIMKKTKLGLRDNDRLKIDRCLIDETKNRKMNPGHAHSCVSSMEC